MISGFFDQFNASRSSAPLGDSTASAAWPGVGKHCLGKDAILTGRIPVRLHQPPPLPPGIAQSCHVVGVISMSHVGRADQNSLGGSGSRSFRSACTENVVYKSAQGEIVTTPHMNSADDNSISGALAATLAYRYQFRARSIKPGGTNCESINMYMVGVSRLIARAEGKCSRHKGWWREGKDELATHSMTTEIWISSRGPISEATCTALQAALEEDEKKDTPSFGKEDLEEIHRSGTEAPGHL